MTVSWPFSAPAWPPETGASRKPTPCAFAAASKLAGDVRRGGGVVDEDRAGLHAGKRAVGPSVTARRSSSLPTQVKTKSAPAAAAAGVVRGTCRRYSATHFVAPCGGAVVDGDVVAAALLEMAGHRIAHDAEADEGDFAIALPRDTQRMVCSPG